MHHDSTKTKRRGQLARTHHHFFLFCSGLILNMGFSFWDCSHLESLVISELVIYWSVYHVASG